MSLPPALVVNPTRFLVDKEKHLANFAVKPESVANVGEVTPTGRVPPFTPNALIVIVVASEPSVESSNLLESVSPVLVYVIAIESSTASIPELFAAKVPLIGSNVEVDTPAFVNKGVKAVFKLVIAVFKSCVVTVAGLSVVGS